MVQDQTRPIWMVDIDFLIVVGSNCGSTQSAFINAEFIQTTFPGKTLVTAGADDQAVKVAHFAVFVGAFKPKLSVFVNEHLARWLVFYKSPVVPFSVDFGVAGRLINAVIARFITGIKIDVVVAPWHMDVKNAAASCIQSLHKSGVLGQVAIAFCPKFDGELIADFFVCKRRHRVIASAHFQLAIAHTITHGHRRGVGIHCKFNCNRTWEIIADNKFNEEVTDAIPNEVLVKNKIVPAYRKRHLRHTRRM